MNRQVNNRFVTLFQSTLGQTHALFKGNVLIAFFENMCTTETPQANISTLYFLQSKTTLKYYFRKKLPFLH